MNVCMYVCMWFFVLVLKKTNILCPSIAWISQQPKKKCTYYRNTMLNVSANQILHFEHDGQWSCRRVWPPIHFQSPAHVSVQEPHAFSRMRLPKRCQSMRPLCLRSWSGLTCLCKSSRHHLHTFFAALPADPQSKIPLGSPSKVAHIHHSPTVTSPWSMRGGIARRCHNGYLCLQGDGVSMILHSEKVQ